MKRVATVLLAVCLLLSLGASFAAAQTPPATAPAASAAPGRGAPPAVAAPTGTAPAGARGAPPTVAPTPTAIAPTTSTGASIAPGTTAATSASVATVSAPNAAIGQQRGQTFVRQRLTDRVDLAVNVVDGNLLVHGVDLHIAGIGLDLAIDRFFNSQSTLLGAVGVGHSLGTGADVRLQPNADGSVYFFGRSGYQVSFTASGSAYTTPPGLDATLVHNADGTYILTFHRSGEQLAFAGGGQLTADTDRNGNHLTFAYNADGTLASVTDTEGRTLTCTYDHTHSPDVLLTKVTDSTGRFVQYAYDSSDHLTAVSDASSQQFKYAWTGGQLTQLTDPKGNITKVAYDGSNRVASIIRVTNVGAGTGPTTTFTYNSGNTAVTDPDSHATTYTYTAQSNGMTLVTSVRDALGHTQAATFNADNNVLTTTDALSPGNTTTNTWAVNNENRTTTQWPASATGVTAASASRTFGNASLPFLPDSGTDAQGNRLTYGYDANGNLDLVSGNGEQVSAAYNTDGTLQYTRDAMAPANQTNFSYTPATHAAGTHFTQTVATPPSPLGATTTNYDSLSRVASTVDGNGKTTTFTYDPLDRITRVTDNGDTGCASRTTCTDYGYDFNGNLTSVVDATGTTSFTYDKQNHQLTKTLPGAGGASVTYTYDAVGNLLTLADAGGTVTYGYDAVNNLTALAEPGGSCTGTVSKCTTFAYDANNRRTSTVYPTSPAVTIAQTYLNNGALKSVIATKAGTGTPLTSFTYAYANATGGDIALRSSVVDGVASTTTTYGYDAFNRLTAAARTGTSYAYGYDNNGNLTTATLNGTSLFSGTPAYNNANELTALGTTAFTYDGNGNQQSGTSGTLVYNFKNQTTSITPPGGSAFAMTYAGDSQVERVTAGGVAYTNDAFGVGSETNGGTTTYYTRTPGGRLVDERIGTSAYYYLFDGLGSVVALVDTSATVKDTYSYDPYGKVTPGGANSVVNPWQYTGGYYDSTTKLVKLGQRYYDPSLGRWTQRDPLGGGYLYASDNPVDFVDLSGLFTLGITVNANINVGPFQVSGQLGLQVSASSQYGFQVGGTTTVGGGFTSAGGGGNLGIGLQASNAQQISDLGGPFGTVGVSGGELLTGSGDTFFGPSPDGPVNGIDVIGGVGADLAPVSVSGGGTVTGGVSFPGGVFP